MIVDTTREEDLSWVRKAMKENRANLQREQNNTPDNKNHNHSTSSSTSEPATPNTLALPPNPSNTNEDMTESVMHPPDPPITLLTTPLKISKEQEKSVLCTDLAIINTVHPAHGRDTTCDNFDEPTPTSYVPGPPNEPPPDTNKIPAPPPPEVQEEDGLPDADGLTWHSNGKIKVTVNCTYCHRQYTTRWGEYPDPYFELASKGWAKGNNKKNYYNWKFARCPGCLASGGRTGA